MSLPALFATLLLALSVFAGLDDGSRLDPYPISPHMLPLRRKPLPDASSLARRQEPISSRTAPIRVGSSYLVDITFGDQTLPIEIDTGSTDLWVVESNFICIEFDTNHAIERSKCDIPRAYNMTSTFSKVGDNYNVEYADGEFANGITGYETVTIAGVDIERQLIGVVNNISWLTGDGYSAGVAGFGFLASSNSITANSITHNASAGDTEENPLFTSLYASGHIQPMFSLALNRSSGLSGGVLALGGIPNITYYPPFASAPLQNTPGTPQSDDSYAQIYQINVTGVTYQSSASGSKAVTNSTGFQVAVDSGTPDTYLPNATTAAINALFDPPATAIGGGSLYSVSCDAKAPSLGIIIGSTAFYMSAADLISSVGNGGCVSHIISGDSDGESNYILGGTFLNNVLAVFDVGNGQMSFASRETKEQLTAAPSFNPSQSPTSSSGSSSSSHTGAGSSLRQTVKFVSFTSLHLIQVFILAVLVLV